MKSALIARPSPFTLAAPSMVYGVLTSPLAAERLRVAIEQLDLGQSRVLGGQEGLAELDEDGRYHGSLCRFARLLQGLTGEREFIEAYAAHLYGGRLVLCVAAPAHSRLAELKEAFKQWGGHTVLRHSQMMTQVLIP